MQDHPEGVSDTDLTTALRDGWDIGVTSISYLPWGAGSYHWRVGDDTGGDWFVTVDALGPVPDSRFAQLRQAFDTAVTLNRRAGLDLVVAPVPTRRGDSVWRLDHRYALTVFPMLAGEAGRFGPHRPQDRPEVVAMLVALHRATPLVVTTAPRADLDLPDRDELTGALADLDQAWTGGPYAEPARKLLTAQQGRVRQWLDEFDQLVGQVQDTAASWVVTHGEPHPGNVLRTEHGLRLVDWETVRLAPPERDLWLLATDGPAGSGDDGTAPDTIDIVTGYESASGRSVDPVAIALYRLRWTLADIAGYLAEFRRPHGESADSAASWTYLNSYFD